MNELNILFILDHPKMLIIEIEKNKKKFEEGIWLLYNKENEQVNFCEFRTINSLKKKMKNTQVVIYKGKYQSENQYVIEVKEEILNFIRLDSNIIPINIQLSIKSYLKRKIIDLY